MSYSSIFLVWLLEKLHFSNFFGWSSPAIIFAMNFPSIFVVVLNQVKIVCDLVERQAKVDFNSKMTSK
jgi:hypothetical protein